MKILFDNKLLSATLMATNEDNNYPVGNLKSPFLRKKFQSTGSNASITATFSPPVQVSSVYKGYTNCKTVVYNLFNAGTMVGKYTCEDACHFPVVTVDEIRVDIDVDGEKVVNGDFWSGSTGWILGAGASVRQQGWVAKLGSLDTSFISPSIPATPGSVGAITGVLNWGDLVAPGVQLSVRWSNSGGSGLADWPLVVWTNTDVGWVVKTNTMTAPANTAFANIVVTVNSYTSGNCYLGFALGTVNGIPVVSNWDFADGTTGWTSVNPGVITYDPTNAYMGNALPGGSGNTFVTDYSLSSYTRANTFEASTGDVFNFEVMAKCLFGTNSLQVRNRYDTGEADQITITAAEASNWVTKTLVSTADGAGITSCTPDILDNFTSGIWLIGSVSVSKVTTDKAYIGGIGAGESVALDPPESFWDETFDDRSIVSESQTGQVLQEYVEPLRNYDFSIPTITRDDLRALQDVYLAYGRGAILWIDPETDDLPVMYGRMTEALSASKNRKLYTAMLKFKEAR